ncbi:MAG TPA: flagellar motor protein [Bryobacteraceae bacterium]|nr:flagellar motor protein [Bryobacteraceae bacterium]
MATKVRAQRADAGSFLGILLAAGGILGGFMYEGGQPLKDMVGPSAALIVFGGCLGATLLSHPPSVMKSALQRTKDIFFEEVLDLDASIETIVAYAGQARKNGLVSLDAEVESVGDPYLKKALMLAVDGADIQEIRTMMELESDAAEERWVRSAKVFESAGGYAPTIGIIGAVLGLILVMNDLDDMKKVGHGIAAAFVATVYGVGAANVLFLPAAQKLKSRAHAQHEREHLILEGICAIVEGMNPKLIRTKLEGFIGHRATAAPRKAAD